MASGSRDIAMSRDFYAPSHWPRMLSKVFAALTFSGTLFQDFGPRTLELRISYHRVSGPDTVWFPEELKLDKGGMIALVPGCDYSVNLMLRQLGTRL